MSNNLKKYQQKTLLSHYCIATTSMPCCICSGIYSVRPKGVIFYSGWSKRCRWKLHHCPRHLNRLRYSRGICAFFTFASACLFPRPWEYINRPCRTGLSIWPGMTSCPPAISRRWPPDLWLQPQHGLIFFWPIMR